MSKFNEEELKTLVDQFMSEGLTERGAKKKAKEQLTIKASQEAATAILPVKKRAKPVVPQAVAPETDDDTTDYLEEINSAPVAEEVEEPEEEEETVPTLAPSPTTALSVAIPGHVIPAAGAIGAELLAKMDGISTPGGYRVAAVKGATAMIALRVLHAANPNHHNIKVKFYPSFAEWGYSMEQLASLGAISYGSRSRYERVLMSRVGSQALFDEIRQKASEQPLTDVLDDRFNATTIRVLMGEFLNEEAPGDTEPFSSSGEDFN